jgi:hypothetical protein
MNRKTNKTTENNLKTREERIEYVEKPIESRGSIDASKGEKKDEVCPPYEYTHLSVDNQQETTLTAKSINVSHARPFLACGDSFTQSQFTVVGKRYSRSTDDLRQTQSPTKKSNAARFGKDASALITSAATPGLRRRAELQKPCRSGQTIVISTPDEVRLFFETAANISGVSHHPKRAPYNVHFNSQANTETPTIRRRGIIARLKDIFKSSFKENSSGTLKSHRRR